MATRNDITGDLIKTKGNLSKQGQDNWDKIFGKKQDRDIPDKWNEERIDIVGQNGNTGEHYPVQLELDFGD